MIEKATTCTFTGHRENKLPWRNSENDERCLALKQRIYDTIEAVYASGIRHYICGMATGCDTFFCEAVIQLRNDYPDITLEAAIPWDGQAQRWNKEQKDRYYRLLAECDYQTLIQTHYSQDCMMKRNKYMVDSSSIVIAAYNGSTGGTMNTMLYAMRHGIQIVELYI